MKSTFSRTIKPSIIVLLTLLSVLLLFLLVVLVCVFVVHTSKGDVAEKEMYSYQSLQYNPSRNESYFGIVTSFDEIPPGEYLSYGSVEGDYTLLSHFGSGEYRCTGSCSCESNKRRSGTTGVINRGIVYLVAAVSSVFALNEAQEYFKEECEEELKDVCRPNSVIMSTVESCQSAGKPDDVSTDEEEEERFGPWMTRYVCRGNCLMNIKYSKFYLTRGLTDVVEKVIELDQQCEAIKYTEEVDLEVKPEHYAHDDALDWKFDDEMFTNSRARIKFEREVLEPFCVANSGTEDGIEGPTKDDILPSWIEKEGNYIDLMVVKSRKAWCTGIQFPPSKVIDPPANVRCRKMVNRDTV